MLLENKRTLTFILAGGKGTRLYPLTRDRSKPAVPFAGRYRIIDFVLSNCLNSGLRQVYLLTQVKSQSLDEHLRTGWNFLNHELKEFIAPVPAQQRISDQWYAGTADAIYQNLNLLEDHRPENVLILSGDHIYSMDFNDLYYQHIQFGSDLTISVKPIKKKDAYQFGVLSMDEKQRITSFLEKPDDPSLIPGEGDDCYINMGIYLFKTDALVRWLSNDATQNSDHDFGKNIIPSMLKNSEVHAFPFHKSVYGNYWRDVGTIGSYYEANMEFLDQLCQEKISTPEWRIRTLGEQLPPSYFENVVLEKASIGTGSHLVNCKVSHSLLGRNVKIGEGSVVENSIIMNNGTIGKNCTIRNSIFDADAQVKDNQKIGVNLEEDQKRFYVSDNIVVFPKNYIVE